MPETQECRDCGDTFPYDEDADYCPDCVAEMHPGLVPDPDDEYPFTILHPTTGDRAYADDREGARLAARTLRNEAVDAGGSPRVRATIIHEALFRGEA